MSAQGEEARPLHPNGQPEQESPSRGRPGRAPRWAALALTTALASAALALAALGAQRGPSSSPLRWRGAVGGGGGQPVAGLWGAPQPVVHRDEFGPSPLRSGARVMLRAHNGALLSVCDNQTVRAVWREVRGRRQAFTIKKIGPGSAISDGDVVVLKAERNDNNLEVGGGVLVQALRKEEGAWQKFVVAGEPGRVMLGDAVCLRAHTGKYIEIRGENVDKEDKAAVLARYGECEGWQKIKLEEAPGRVQSGSTIFLRSSSGWLLDVRLADGAVGATAAQEHHAGQDLVVEAKRRGPIRYGDNVSLGNGTHHLASSGRIVAFRSNGSSRAGGNFTVMRPRGAELGGAPFVYFLDRVLLRSAKGPYVSAEGGSVSAAAENRSASAEFVVEQARGGWVMGGFGGSCEEACRASGLTCDASRMRAHMEEAASPADMEAVLERLQGMGCDSSEEKSGSQPEVQFRGGRPHCRLPDGARAVSGAAPPERVNCSARPMGPATRRLCWCAEPAVGLPQPNATGTALMTAGAGFRRESLDMGPGKLCPGAITLAGWGNATLVNAIWETPGMPARVVEVREGKVLPHMQGRAYLAESCDGVRHHRRAYARINLLSKTLRYTVDLSGAGCGCNAALYLAAMPQNELASGCNDFSCDAASTCGVACAQIEIQAANQHAWASALHAFDDEGGLSAGSGGGRNTFDSSKYGPGGECVDTSRPFRVAASFPIGDEGHLSKIFVELSQDGSPCSLPMSLEDYLPERRKGGLAELTQAIAVGMTPVVRYWGAPGLTGRSGDMLWLDSGPCSGGRPSACADTVKFYNFSVEDVNYDRQKMQ